MASVIGCASCGSVQQMEGIGEVPMHKVSILVLEVLTKQPSHAPRDLSVLQRKRRSLR